MRRPEIPRAVICLCLLTLAAGWWQTRPVDAQEPEPPEYTGLDLILLLDQSGSMGGLEAGSATHPLPNDQNGWRFDVPLALVRQLGPLLYIVHPESTVRLAMVEFGDSAQVVLPATTIEARTEEEWLPQCEDLVTRLEEYESERSIRSLGNTNHQSAFLLARELFDDMEAEDSSERLRVIIVVTDGRPCVGTVDPATGEPGCQPWAPHLVELRDRLVPRHFPAEEGYQIFVLAVNDSSDHYWPDTRPYWEAIAGSHGGRAERPASWEDAARFVAEILHAELSSLPYSYSSLPPVPPIPELADSGFYAVVPYLQSITFGIFKSLPADWIGLEEVDTVLAVAESSADGRIRVAGNSPQTMYGQIVVLRPRPGYWRIQRPPGSRVIVTVQGIPFSPQLISPAGDHALGVPARIQLNLVDDSGEFVAEYDDPLYALEVVATVSTEGGEESVELVLEEAGVYAGVMVPWTTGVNVVHLRATSHDPEGAEYVVMDREVGAFTVTPLTAQLESPVGEVYQNVPVRLAYRFLDSRGNRIREAEGGEVALLVEVTVTGEEDTQTVRLVQEASGVYSTEYVAVEPGMHRIQLRVAVEDESGDERVVLEEEGDTFEVRPTVGLTYAVVRPQDGVRDYIRPWWLFPTRPLVTELEVRGEDGQPVPLSQVVAGAPEEAFTLTITDPAGRDRSSEVSWSLTDTPGGLRAIGEGLVDVGDWTIEVAPTFDPVPGYALTSWAATRVVVTRAEHYLAFGVDGLVLLGLMAAVVGAVLQHRAATRPPLLRGVLYIRDAAGTVVWTRPLPGRRNRIRFGRRDLPVVTRLKSLSVMRTVGKEEAIELVGRLDDGGAVAITRMMYKSRRQLGGYQLYLHYEQY